MASTLHGLCMAPLIILLASTFHAVHAQGVKEGDVCGPLKYKNPCSATAPRWVAIPATSLFATGSAGVSSAVAGCVVSDRGFAANAHAYLPTGTWNIYNVTAKIKANDPVNASSVLRVLKGDAGVHSQPAAAASNSQPADIRTASIAPDTCELQLMHVKLLLLLLPL